MSAAPVAFPGATPGRLFQVDADGYLVPVVRADATAAEPGDVVTRVADLHGAGLDGWAAAPASGGADLLIDSDGDWLADTDGAYLTESD